MEPQIFMTLEQVEGDRPRAPPEASPSEAPAYSDRTMSTQYHYRKSVRGLQGLSKTLHIFPQSDEAAPQTVARDGLQVVVTIQCRLAQVLWNHL